MDKSSTGYKPTSRQMSVVIAAPGIRSRAIRHPEHLGAGMLENREDLTKVNKQQSARESTALLPEAGYSGRSESPTFTGNSENKVGR